MERPNKTIRQHRIVMNRMGKILRLFRPDGMTNVDWYYNLAYNNKMNKDQNNLMQIRFMKYVYQDDI
jgi:hypothetical protein